MMKKANKQIKRNKNSRHIIIFSIVYCTHVWFWNVEEILIFVKYTAINWHEIKMVRWWHRNSLNNRAVHKNGQLYLKFHWNLINCLFINWEKDERNGVGAKNRYGKLILEWRQSAERVWMFGCNQKLIGYWWKVGRFKFGPAFVQVATTAHQQHDNGYDENVICGRWMV